MNVLFNDGDIELVSYSRGTGRGIGYQLTLTTGHHVQLTEHQALQLLRALRAALTTGECCEQYEHCHMACVARERRAG